MENMKNAAKLVLWIAGQPFAQSRARVTDNGTYSSASGSLRMWRDRMEGEIVRARRLLNLEPLAGPLGLCLTFHVGTKDKTRWGQWCYMKPDYDNLAKAVSDVAEKAGLFKTGDQQITQAKIIKLWSSPAEAGVLVEFEELGSRAIKNPAGGAGFLFEG